MLRTCILVLTLDNVTVPGSVVPVVPRLANCSSSVIIVHVLMCERGLDVKSCQEGKNYPHATCKYGYVYAIKSICNWFDHECFMSLETDMIKYVGGRGVTVQGVLDFS